MQCTIGVGFVLVPHQAAIVWKPCHRKMCGNASEQHDLDGDEWNIRGHEVDGVDVLGNNLYSPTSIVVRGQQRHGWTNGVGTGRCLFLCLCGCRECSHSHTDHVGHQDGRVRGRNGDISQRGGGECPAICGVSADVVLWQCGILHRLRAAIYAVNMGPMVISNCAFIHNQQVNIHTPIFNTSFLFSIIQMPITMLSSRYALSLTYLYLNCSSLFIFTNY